MIVNESIWESSPDLAVQLLDQTDGWNYSYKSNVKVLWWCQLKHSWWSTPKNRSQGRGCPYCAGNRVLKGFNDLWTTHPHVAQQLVTTEDGYEVSSGSNKKFSWFCSKGHKISVSVCGMVKSPTTCYYCSNKKVLIGFNDLWTTDPDLAVQLLDQTDGFRYTRGSDKVKLNWVCPKKHIWLSTINNRTGHYKTGCPRCFNRISKPEIIISEFFSDYGYQVIQQFKPDGLNFIPDIYIPSLNLIIEYDGSWFHRSTLNNDTEKTVKLIQKGFKIARIRESNDIILDYINLENVNLYQLTYKYQTDLKGLHGICSSILDWISIEK